LLRLGDLSASFETIHDGHLHVLTEQKGKDRLVRWNN